MKVTENKLDKLKILLKSLKHTYNSRRRKKGTRKLELRNKIGSWLQSWKQRKQGLAKEFKGMKASALQW
jgi:hypothetical protein